MSDGFRNFSIMRCFIEHGNIIIVLCVICVHTLVISTFMRIPDLTNKKRTLFLILSTFMRIPDLTNKNEYYS